MLAPLARLRDALADALARAGVRPDAVSVAGVVVALGAAAFLWQGALDVSPFAPGRAGRTVSLLPLGACACLTVSGFLDVVDGALARRHRMAGRWGAYLDSTLDRVADLAVHAGMAARFARDGREALVVLTLLAFAHGALIAYLRSRAEALVPVAAVGFWQRSERTILLGFGAFWGHVPQAVLVLGTLPALTAWRRFRHAGRLLKGAPEAEAARSRMALERGSIAYCLVAAALMAFVLLAPAG